MSVKLSLFNIRCIREVLVFGRSVERDSASHVPVRTRATAVMGSGKEKMVDRADHRTSHAVRSHETRHKQWT
jgi:hypothetical protein